MTKKAKIIIQKQEMGMIIMTMKMEVMVQVCQAVLEVMVVMLMMKMMEIYLL